MAKNQLYLPVSVGKKYMQDKKRRASLSQREREARRILGSAEDNTFNVGPNNKPVYIPGSANLDGRQLEEILHKAEEEAVQEAKEFEKNKPRPVTREEADDLRGGLRAMADWRRKRK